MLYILKQQPVTAGGWSILLTQLLKRLNDSESQEQNAAASFGSNNTVSWPHHFIVLHHTLTQVLCTCVQMSNNRCLSSFIFGFRVEISDLRDRSFNCTETLPGKVQSCWFWTCALPFNKLNIPTFMPPLPTFLVQSQASVLSTYTQSCWVMLLLQLKHVFLFIIWTFFCPHPERLSQRFWRKRKLCVKSHFQTVNFWCFRFDSMRGWPFSIKLSYCDWMV